MARALLGWPIIVVVVAALVILGAGAVSAQARSPRAAQVSFSAAAVILMTKTLWWLVFDAPGVSTPSRLIVALVIVGVAGAWWAGAISWARRP